MTTNKPAKMITRLIEVRKADAAAIADLNKKLQEVNEKLETRDGLVRQLNNGLADYEQKISIMQTEASNLEKQNSNLRNSLAAIGEELLATGASLIQAQDEIKLIRAIYEAEAVVARENADILGQLEPQIEGIELARQDLSKILDNVRDRMKRKDLEAERAILNRKTLAGARPDLNRR